MCDEVKLGLGFSNEFFETMPTAQIFFEITGR